MLPTFQNVLKIIKRFDFCTKISFIEATFCTKNLLLKNNEKKTFLSITREVHVRMLPTFQNVLKIK